MDQLCVQFASSLRITTGGGEVKYYVVYVIVQHVSITDTATCMMPQEG